jgi:hypothetical protein
MALLSLSGQGLPLAPDFPYGGQWLIEDRWFLFAADTPERGADQDIVTVATSEAPLTGFNARMLAVKLGLTTDDLFDADRIGRLTLHHVDTPKGGLIFGLQTVSLTR